MRTTLEQRARWRALALQREGLTPEQLLYRSIIFDLLADLEEALQR